MTENEELALPETPAEKPKRQRKSKPKDTFSVTLEDGSVIDLDSFDYGDVKLTQKEKLFILWYTYPASSSYHDSAKSARKAGYSQKNARMSGYNLRHNPKIAPLIAQFDKDVVKTGIEDAYHRIIQRKIARSEFKGLDFYNIENHIAKR